jgi:chromosome segregation ATPase
MRKPSRHAGSFSSEIQHSLESVNRQLTSVKRDAPRLQGRIAQLKARRTEREAELRSVQQDVAKRIAENERIRIAQDQFTEQARVAGRIGYYLENAVTIEAPDGLRQEITRVEAEIAELERAVDHEGLEERLATALSLVGR